MRIQIKTDGPVKDADMRALYLMVYAIEISSPHMKKANLAFVADRLGLRLIPKFGNALSGALEGKP